MRFFRKLENNIYNARISGTEDNGIFVMYQGNEKNLLFYYTVNDEIPSAISIKSSIAENVVDAICSEFETNMTSAEHEVRIDNFIFAVKSRYVTIGYVANDVKFSIECIFEYNELDKIHTRNSRILGTMRELQDIISGKMICDGDVTS